MVGALEMLVFLGFLVLSYLWSLAIFSGAFKYIFIFIFGLVGLQWSFKAKIDHLVAMLFLILALGSSYRGDVAQGTYYLRFLFLGFFCMRLLFENPNLKRKDTYDFVHFLAAIYLIFIFGSIFYSVDTKVTALRAFSFLFLYGLIFIGLWRHCQSEEEIVQIVKSLLKMFLFILCMGCFILLLQPGSMFDGGRLRLVFGNPNQLGNICGIFTPMILWQFLSPDNKQKYWPKVLISLVMICLVTSGSRSGMLSATLGSCLFVFVKHRNLFYKVTFVLALTFILQSLIGELWSVDSYVDPNSSYWRVETLKTGSGRFGVWQSAQNLVSQRPLFGYGFASVEALFRKGYFLNIPLDFEGMHIHNGYLEELVNMGIVGSSPMFLMMILVFFRQLSGYMQNAAHFSYARLALFGSFVAGLSSAVFESWLTSVGSIFCFPFWLILAMLCRMESLEKESVEKVKKVCVE